MKDVVVLYHADCWDGFGAAWAAWKKFGKKAEYIPVSYEKDSPKGLTNKEIFLVDFCYDKGLMKKIISRNKKVVVIDHHVSRRDFVEGTKGWVYGTDNSGAVLSWKYFHPEKKIPKLLNYVEDNDLWKFKLWKSKEAILAADVLPYKFEIWDKLARDFENRRKFLEYVKKGEAILEYIKMIVDVLVEKGDRVVFEGKKSLAVNAPHLLASDIGNAIVKKGFPMGIVWYKENDGIHVSLRAQGKVDVSKIAVKYGGGGHKNASGFAWPENKKFPWKVI